MWNDEDNNPYGAFDRHPPPGSHPAAMPAAAAYQEPASPILDRPGTPSDHEDDDDDKEPESAQPAAGGYAGTRSHLRQQDAYESRMQQILSQNPEIPILITHAGKNHEGGGGFIVYTIRTGDLEVRRRYSEFNSLRATLVNLHPTLIVPPIPEKHSMADYAAKPTKAKEDASIIELRKRMLGVFLNRCRKMDEIREDGVWWRFLDPNASWSEVLQSHPAASVPKNNLKAPPLDPANPKPAHNWLPVPASSAKLKTAGQGAAPDSSAPGTVPGFLNRFPPSSRNMNESELDPYFMNFEASTRELELLLQGNIEKVNRRMLTHLSSLATDLMELGARYNGFSLSETSPTVAAAIERVGQAADNSYIETEELSNSLNATFAEPMRESAQFAGVVRSVLRYRVLKRIQEEMTRDELAKKKVLLESLERSELEAKRIEQYLNKTGPPATKPKRSLSDAAAPSSTEAAREGSPEDTASIDSDFPPTHGEPRPSAAQGLPQRPADLSTATSPGHKHSSSGSFMANKLFGRISHAVHGFVDVDPERTRRDQISKTRESLTQLEQALEVSEQDVQDASAGVLQDLKRFQREKEDDLRRYMVAYARCHLDWARKNLETWTEAKDEVDKVVVRRLSFTTSSSKRRKVAAELRRAGARTGFHFPRPPASARPSRALKRLTGSPSCCLSPDSSACHLLCSSAAAMASPEPPDQPHETLDSSCRAASPAVKRPAAEMGADEPRSNDSGGDSAAAAPDLLDSAKPKKKNDRLVRSASSLDVDDTSHSEGQGTGMLPTSSTASTDTVSSYDSSRPPPSSHSSVSSPDSPSIDEQVATVMQMTMQPAKEGQRGYVVSCTWLRRVLARSTSGPKREKTDKAATSGAIGPVDNSDLVLTADASNQFKDEAGETFVPLRTGLQIGDDFEILPQEAWELIVKWYGLAKDTPIIARYAHNTSPGDTENIQFELNPPIFTILKLSCPTAAKPPSGKTEAPVKVLASSHTPFQQWLRSIKKIASIEPTTKVRVWRILEGLVNSGNATPALSRSASPAPGSTLIANAGSNLVLDINKFVALSDGSQRELVDMPDQTGNEKYNGKSTLHLVGLSSDNVIVLEEQIGGAGGGEWVSDTAKYGPSRLTALTTTGKGAAQSKPKANAATSNGRSSPAPTTVTRGRKRKDGKTRGVTGLSNLGNTCYMNSALQCVRSVEELTQYFLANEYKKDLNPSNPLSHNGDVAKAYASLLHQMFDENGSESVSPRNFKLTVGRYGPSFSGYGQQDSQEFVLFLLDGLQEDLNRIHKKPYIEKPDSTDDMVHDKAALARFADRNWEIYKARNDSVITDLFAGMYKSTVVCPVCGKVSIIFDPFSNLTLQIPIETVWSKKIHFYPVHERPYLVDVDIDKNASIKSLKELVAKKAHTDARRLIMAEVYLNRIHRLFPNTSSICDTKIGESDEIAMYELEQVPTSYDANRPEKQGFSMLYANLRDDEDAEVASFDSEKADRILVPIINRVLKSSKYTTQWSLFGNPRFVVITREEAMDYDAIQRKILAQVSTLTTQDILAEDDGMTMRSNSADDSDTVVMNDDDANSNDSKIKMDFVEGDDGLVDVSMWDAADDGACLPKALRPGSFIPPALQNLFEIKFLKTHDPAGIGSFTDESKDLPSMRKRVRSKKAAKRTGPKLKTIPVARSNTSPVSSEDELTHPIFSMQTNRTKLKESLSNYSSSEETKRDSASDTDSDLSPVTHPIRRKEQGHKRKAAVPKRGFPASLPYIRPGEAIVLDWNESAHDSLFGGDIRDKQSLRGTPTWEDVRGLPDPELSRKRQLRQSKKRSGVTLNECLDEFGREEILSENDAWYCPRCKEHRRASKRFELWTVPDILVMHLKRFSANRNFRDKLDVYVDYPLELDMTGRAQAPDDGKSMMYDLIAVDNHYGGLGGGHYTAYAKSFVDGNWYEFNDSRVLKKPNAQSVVTNAGYLLFYRRRSDHPLGGSYLAGVTDSVNQKHRADSDSPEDSDGNPGEGKRLDDSSRNGSLSALAEAAAIHRAGDGGLQGEFLHRNNDYDDNDDDDDDDGLPRYLDTIGNGTTILPHGAGPEGMDIDSYAYGYGPQQTSLFKQQEWSFDRVPHDSVYGNDDEDDDNLSMKAVGGGDSDSDTQTQPLGSSMGPEQGLSAMGFNAHGPVSIFGMDEEADDDVLPVVELHVDESS
ncbi:hypothetical protein LOZ12_005579 [Ophidiomyces ophidiicola]|nr:hypothetical protein LOZ12_005579 [Ophidiomyces ophidiicola]